MTGTPKRTRRRWIWPVVAALGLSAVVQVGIVVMPDSWYVWMRGNPGPAESSQFTITENSRRWVVFGLDLGLFGETISAQVWHADWPEVETESEETLVLRDLVMPNWSMFAQTRGTDALAITTEWREGDWDQYVVSERAEGWPWRCVRGETRRVSWWQSKPAFDKIADTGVVRLYGNTWVPYLPIWSGLVLNLVVLALPWYAVFWLVGSGRRIYRRQRGRCGECGYDLAGLDRDTACPECGEGPSTVVVEPSTVAVGRSTVAVDP